MSQTLKLSAKTSTVLRNFSSINKSILVRPGKKLMTISETKSVIAVADVEEEFTSQFAIYEVSRLLAVLSLFKEPELNIEEKVLTIKEGKRKLNYTFCAENTVQSVEEVTIGKLAAVAKGADAQTFVLTNEVFQDVIKTLSVMKLPELAFVGAEGRVRVRALDTSGATKDTYEVEVGESTVDFEAVFAAENLKILPNDYTVSLSPKGLANFKAADIEYYIATKPPKK